jgi:hypothetical protein
LYFAGKSKYLNLFLLLSFAEKKVTKKAAQKSKLMALLSHWPPPHGAQSHYFRTFLGLPAHR